MTSTIVAYARTGEEESSIEAALEGAGISYSIRLDAVPEATERTACSLACVYAVEQENAGRAKATLEKAGLDNRVIAPREHGECPNE